LNTLANMPSQIEIHNDGAAILALSHDHRQVRTRNGLAFANIRRGDHVAEPLVMTLG